MNILESTEKCWTIELLKRLLFLAFRNRIGHLGGLKKEKLVNEI